MENFVITKFNSFYTSRDREGRKVWYVDRKYACFIITLQGKIRFSYEGGEVIARYTDGFCREKPAIVKNGNVYYVGFYSRGFTELYCDLVSRHVETRMPIAPDLEEVKLGTYRMYLNYSEKSVPLSGYDLLIEEQFTEIPAYGVVLVKE